MHVSEAKASHLHKTWTEVSSSVPHFLKSYCPLGPKKEPRYPTLFPQRVSASEYPPGSPAGFLWREIPAYRTGSPWAAILRHQSHWSAFHSFMYVCRSPQNLLLYLQLKLISFKVLSSTLDTPLPTFFPVLERVLERVLRDGAKVPYRIFLYCLKSATFY